MTTFLLDIWHDLREKRLWPIAVALVAATVAIPVVLMKPAEVPPPPQAPQGAQTAALPTVASDPTIVDSSHLDSFDIRNPFGSGADRSSAGSMPGGSPDDAATGASGGGSAAGDPAGAAGGSGSGGGTAGGGGGTGGSGGSGGGTRYFTYTVDVHFGPRGETRAFKGVETLDLLPDDQTPVVSFMGMRDNAKTAVFFIVDPTFEADGEGECAPSAEDCRFIYLGVDDDRNEETLAAADGNLEFQLKLDKIHIKRLSGAEAQGDAQPDSSDSPQRKGQSKGKREHTLLTVPLAARR